MEPIKKPVGGVRIHRPTFSAKPIPESEPVTKDRTPRITSDVSALFPLSTRPLGTTIIGQTGMGKTSLLLSLVKQDLKNGITCLVLDPMGDLSNDLLAYASTTMPERTILLQVNPDQPFGLNLYECPAPLSIVAVDRTVDTVVQLFRKLWNEDRMFFPRVEFVIRNTCRTILANVGYTLAEVPLLLSNKPLRDKLLRNVKNPEVLQFWVDYETRNPRLQTELTESSILRISQFLQSEFIYRVVSQSQTTLPFSEVFRQEGMLVIAKFPIGELGEGVTEFIGSIFLSVLTNLIYEREKLPMDQRVRVHLYLEEYARWASTTSSALLREGRKFNIGTTVAFQTLSDLQDQDNRAAVLQVGTLAVFQVIPEDAAVLAPEFAEKPQEAWEQEIRAEEVEILKPQWHERIEEQVAIEVEEDIMEIAQNPVEYLISTRGTHSSKAVREITQRILMELTDKQKLTINHLLISIMEGDIQLETEALEEVLLVIYQNISFILLSQDELKSLWLLVLSQPAGSASIQNFIDEIINERIKKHMRDFKQTLIDQRELKYDYATNPDFYHRMAAVGLLNDEEIRHAQKEAKEREKEEEEQYENEKKRIVTENSIRDSLEHKINEIAVLLSDLKTLCQELAKEPIRVPTGQKRMVKRIQPHITYLPHESEKITHPRIAITYPQRTYQDMVNEMTQKLASLSRFTCMIQSIDSEGQVQERLVQTPPPVQTVSDRRGVNQIIANSAQYYRPWVEVEKEIKERQYIPPPEEKEPETATDKNVGTKKPKPLPPERGKPLKE